MTPVKGPHTLPGAMNVIQVESRGQLPWSVIRAKGGHWVAVCEPLSLTIQSDTWATLMEDIAHALNALLVDLMQEGELDAFLRERGWRLVGPIPSKPDEAWFDVPFEPTRKTDRDLEIALR
ncbi:MAG: hypothetical protein ACRELS_18565 [Candidatus Rokuibacteriota bacterium]